MPPAASITLQAIDIDTDKVVPRTKQRRVYTCLRTVRMLLNQLAHRVVIYDTDSSGAVLGKQPIFVIEGVFVISVLISVCITCVVIAGVLVVAVAILVGCLKKKPKNFKGEVS